MIELLISSLCLQLNNIPEASKYYTSCISSAQAISIQTKVKPLWEQFQRDLENNVKKETGETMWVGIGTIYAYNQRGTINFNFPARPLIDSVSFKGDPKGNVDISLNWSW